jgi:hypothetical protein
MGYKKTIQRNEISGAFEHNDIQSGEVSVNELRNRMDARQTAINEAHKKDWPANMTSSNPESTDPTLGNAFTRLPKPADYMVGSKSDRFGSSAEDDTNPSTQGGAPQKTAKVKGIEQPKKRG